MKIRSHWRSLTGLLFISVCTYFLGCEPNEVLDSIQQQLEQGEVLPNAGLGNQNGNLANQQHAPNSNSNGASQNPSGGIVGGVPGRITQNPAAAYPSSQSQVPGGQLVSNSNTAFRGAGLPVRNPNTILIATFNIQVLGRTKISKPGNPEQLAKVIRLFDVVAIQELRDNTNSTIPALMQYINADGSQYQYLISQPLGRTSVKEQYVYIYNTQTIIGSPDATYVVDDAERDLLHREPFVARFVTRIPVQYNPFTFTLVNIHTDPDEVSQEIPVMHTVLQAIRNFEYQTAKEDDVLLMGDLNVAPKDFRELGRLPGIYWVTNDFTNVARNRIFDNILFDQYQTNEHTGRSGVLQLDQFLGITREEEKAISDHLPVWAEFTITEQPHSNGNNNVANSVDGLSVR